MKQVTKLALALSPIICTSPAMAADGIFLLGCAEDANGGSVVVVSESTDPIHLVDGALVLPADLLGLRCAAVLRRLLDSNRVHPSDITASSHLVISAARRDRDDDDEGEPSSVEVPDCLIWDIDTAGVGYVQLTCDVIGGMTIAGQDSAASRASLDLLADYVGRPCLDALADLGGLANLVRSSVTRPERRDDDRQRREDRETTSRVSVLIYQLAVKLS